MTSTISRPRAALGPVTLHLLITHVYNNEYFEAESGPGPFLLLLLMTRVYGNNQSEAESSPRARFCCSG